MNLSCFSETLQYGMIFIEVVYPISISKCFCAVIFCMFYEETYVFRKKINLKATEFITLAISKRYRIGLICYKKW